MSLAGRGFSYMRYYYAQIALCVATLFGAGAVPIAAQCLGNSCPLCFNN